MGEKVDAKYDFGFEMPEEGVHVVVLAEPKSSQYDCIDREKVNHGKGYQFSVKCIVDGGPSDGLWHYESWRTRWPSGDLNTKAIGALNGFLIKSGAKPDGPIDTDDVESDRFAKKFEGIAGKSLGLDIFHQKDKQDKVWSRSKSYMTVAEAKAKMGNSGKGKEKPMPVSGTTTSAPPAKDAEGW